MFTTHFKMATQPFLENTAAQHILKDERISEGLARLQYLATYGTLALVTGPTGVGKSSLIKLLLSSLSGNRFQPAYVTGAGPKIFEPEAKALIHDYAGGLPRQVNNIATACLINAAAANPQKINQPLVNQTIDEFQLP